MNDDAKDIIFQEDARNKLKEGIDQLADVVGITLGPRAAMSVSKLLGDLCKSRTTDIQSPKISK